MHHIQEKQTRFPILPAVPEGRELVGQFRWVSWSSQDNGRQALCLQFADSELGLPAPLAAIIIMTSGRVAEEHVGNSFLARLLE
jgi:hypothetical protein